MTDFKSIRFGYASAEKEGSHAPDLILRGFYDQDGTVAEARDGDRFLFLGYKGSGKSAIGQRLILDAEADDQLNVVPLTLKDFPFAAFGRVGVGSDEPESKYPTTWAWLLLLRLLDSFNRDLSSAKTPQFQKAIGALERAGYLPIGDFKGLVVRSSKNSFKASVPGLVEAIREESVANLDVGFLQLVEHLRILTQNFRGPARHVIVIDGLDDILIQRDIQWISLGALMQEVSRINDDLAAYAVPAKIVLLCRTDMFERFPDANKNKMRRDSAVVLDWYHDVKHPENSALVALADLRVQYSAGDPDVCLSSYLPPTMGGESSIKALLSLTRHTPRDFLQLLECVQDFTSPTAGVISRDAIEKGMRKYSIEYFLPEIRDELVGVGTAEEIESMISLLSAMRSRDFKYKDLLNTAVELQVPLSSSKIREIVVALFERSALGTVHSNRNGYSSYTFKYRNRNSTLGFPDRLLLHRGIWKGLGIS
ncbi:P-loop ATPase, Sll1717 family [Agromyces sp. NPDC058064]|uniref:P-loop ATPase, Sll1717 family n=1 Tax=Agromyces sp. NPDC058064 TaxID=3346322 RepID=UPI0036DCD6AB